MSIKKAHVCRLQQRYHYRAFSIVVNRKTDVLPILPLLLPQWVLDSCSPTEYTAPDMVIVRFVVGLLFATVLLFTAAEGRCAAFNRDYTVSIVTLETSRTTTIILLDQQLFLYVNSLHSPFWDEVMLLISGKRIWIPLFLAILLFLGIKYKRKFPVILLLFFLGFALTQLGSVYLFKNTFQRLRPCHEPALEGLVHVVGQSSSLHGFVSSHAANCFFLAVLSGFFVRKRWFAISMICWAAIISYSRIYLGMHYPGDVVCGAAFGTLMGWGTFKLYNLADTRSGSNRSTSPETSRSLEGEDSPPSQKTIAYPAVKNGTSVCRSQ